MLSSRLKVSMSRERESSGEVLPRVQGALRPMGYHAHVSQLQPHSKQDPLLPDSNESRVCEYKLWLLDPTSNWKAISSSLSSPPQSPFTRRPPLVKRSVSTGSTARRARGSTSRTSMP